MKRDLFVVLRNLGNDWPEIVGIFNSQKRAEQTRDAMDVQQRAQARANIYLSNMADEEIHKIEESATEGYEYRIEKHVLRGYVEEPVDSEPEIKAIFG